MENAKAFSTPVDPSTKLMKATENCKDVDQSAVGSLLHLSTRTRPDIAYAVSIVARFTVKPSKQHWTAVKCIMQYLIGTLNFGLVYSRDGSKDCIRYSDADWVGESNDDF